LKDEELPSSNLLLISVIHILKPQIIMKSFENFIRKIEKEAIKLPIDVSDIIPSDTLDIFTQEESSNKKELFNYLTSDQFSILDKLYTFSR